MTQKSKRSSTAPASSNPKMTHPDAEFPPARGVGFGQYVLTVENVVFTQTVDALWHVRDSECMLSPILRDVSLAAGSDYQHSRPFLLGLRIGARKEKFLDSSVPATSCPRLLQSWSSIPKVIWTILEGCKGSWRLPARLLQALGGATFGSEAQL